ncbi:MAG: glycosyltransferase family 2 protein [Clostridia bacterium]|nr:glycosyltransferase family 2 protein [Clostridia bacterium]
MGKNSIVSIIIPVYNVAPYLPRCLDSVLAQTYASIEVVCVDDGSPDEAGAILDDYAKKDVRIKVIHKENAGVSAARLDGVKAATGDYIGFVDGDDEIEPDMYERLIHNLQKADADISHCGHVVIYPDGHNEFFYGTKKKISQNKTDALKDLLLGNFEPGLCNKLYKRTVVERFYHSGKMNQSIKFHEDLLMNYYLFREAETSVFEDVCLYRYMKREGSASAPDLHIETPDALSVSRQMYEDSIGTPEERAAKTAYLSTALHQYNNLLGKGDDYTAEKQMVKEALDMTRDAAAGLGKKQRIFLKLIRHTPHLYRLIFRVAKGR